MKNKYILVEEVKQAIDKIKEKDSKLRAMIYFIYNNGKKVSEAHKLSGIEVGIRECQKKLKKFSKGNFNFQDLRRSYLLDHPHLIFRLKKNRKNGRIPINPRLRWKILCRDNFRCIACGISSKETILHIDHIVPYSLGGSNEESNLRTLCGKCNMGKGTLLIK